jgi:hypothetical protein
VLLIAILRPRGSPASGGGPENSARPRVDFTAPIYNLSLDFAHLPRIIAFRSSPPLFITAGGSSRRARPKVRERTAVARSSPAADHAGTGAPAASGRAARSSARCSASDSGSISAHKRKTPVPSATHRTAAGRIAAITDEIRPVASAALLGARLPRAFRRCSSSEFSIQHNIAIEFAHGALRRAAGGRAVPVPRDRGGLTNIAKHSEAESTRVDERSADGIHLTIEDSGRGFDGTSVERRDGLGFVSMRERLRIVSGTVRVDSAPLRGTRVSVWVPPGPVVSFFGLTRPDDTLIGPSGVTAQGVPIFTRGNRSTTRTRPAEESRRQLRPTSSWSTSGCRSTASTRANSSRLHPGIRSFSAEPRAAVRGRAFRRQASGYLLKDSAASELTTAIRDAVNGKPTSRPRSAWATSRRPRPGHLALRGLSQREREVLQLLAEQVDEGSGRCARHQPADGEFHKYASWSCCASPGRLVKKPQARLIAP